jgi:hypothetical protein
LTEPNLVHRMDLKGAQALAKHLNDPGANPPIHARADSNGPSHKAVVHVTFGQPKPQDKTDRDGNVTSRTPDRPAPYTIS